MLFLPGGLIGSGLRWVKITSSGKSAETLGAIAYNRMVELIVIVLAGVLWYLAGVEKEILDLNILILLIISLLIAFFIFIYSTRHIANWFEKSNKTTFKHLYIQKIWGYFNRTIQSIKVYTILPFKESLTIFGVSFLSYLVGLTSYVFLARSTGMDISVFNLGWTQSVIFLTALTPLSIAGGLGIRDISLVFLLSLFGIEPEVALAFSLMIFFRGFLLSAIGGIIEFIEILKNRKVEI